MHENWNRCRLLFLSVQKRSAAGGDQDKDFGSSVRHVLLQHGRWVAGHAPPALDWQNSTVRADRRLPASSQPWQKECSCWGFLRLLVVVLYVLSSTVSRRNILNHWNMTDVKDECVVAACFFVFCFYLWWMQACLWLILLIFISLQIMHSQILLLFGVCVFFYPRSKRHPLKRCKSMDRECSWQQHVKQGFLP